MKQLIAWSSRVMLIVSAVYLVTFGLIWFFKPMRALANGSLLGGLISLYNIFHLAFRLRIAGLRVRSGSRKPAGLHMTVRFLTVIFGALLVYRFPTRIDYHSFVLSLLFGYLLLVTVISFYYLRKRSTISSDEGGETLGSDSESKVSRNDV